MLNEELLQLMQDPANHDMLADTLAKLSPPPTPASLQQMTQISQQSQGGQGFEQALDPLSNTMVAQGAEPGFIPTGPTKAPPPKPGERWWNPPSDPRPTEPQQTPIVKTPREQQLEQGKPPSGGFSPNKDRQWREDITTLSDEEFKAKWGVPKPGGI